MNARIGLCQMPAAPTPEANLGTVKKILARDEADVHIFPELFLTGYGYPLEGKDMRVELAMGEISKICEREDRAVAIGMPRFASDGKVYNSLAFVSPDVTVCYDKAHLAQFGPYAEPEFTAGSGPAIAEYHGIRFGLSVCYDAFFPEIMHGNSLRGADVNICVAASAAGSKPYFDKIAAARALENVTYFAFVNNIGPLSGLMMHGCSRAYGPLGDIVADCGTKLREAVFEFDPVELARARKVRHHLDDFRKDIAWLPERSAHQARFSEAAVQCRPADAQDVRHLPRSISPRVDVQLDLAEGLDADFLPPPAHAGRVRLLRILRLV